MSRLLIVEESMKDLKGHWFELFKIIRDSAEKNAWKTNIACNYYAVEAIRETFSVFPIFKHARYIDTNKKKLFGEKYYSLFLHNYRSLRVLWPLLKQQENYDMIFAPTVLVHHLIMWHFIMSFHPNKPKKLTLFFVTNPGVWDDKKKEAFFPKSSLILKLCIKLFTALVKKKIVILGVGSGKTKEEFEKLCNLPFSLMPQPVPLDLDNGKCLTEERILNTNDTCVFSCVGFARHEKGSDILKNAIEKILVGYPDYPIKFIVQWTDNFLLPDGTLCTPGPFLSSSSKVVLIQKPLNTAEYKDILDQTNCMVLPYRNSSYYARFSQIATEAVCLGIPIIYTKGGWLEETTTQLGAGIGIADESTEELIAAILTMLQKINVYQDEAKITMTKAKEYYSADHFIHSLLDK